MLEDCKPLSCSLDAKQLYCPFSGFVPWSGEGREGRGYSAYYGLYGEAPPGRGIFFRPDRYMKG